MTVEDSQTDIDDEEVSTETKVSNVSKDKVISRIVEDQVYGDIQKFDKVSNEKGAHYLETNIIVYENFIWTDDVIFPTQVFLTYGNADNVKPKFNKLVEEDNKNISNERSFSSESTVENNHTKNSYTFQ